MNRCAKIARMRSRVRARLDAGHSVAVWTLDGLISGQQWLDAKAAPTP